MRWCYPSPEWMVPPRSALVADLGLEAAHFDGFTVIEGSDQEVYRMYGMATNAGNNIFGLVILALRITRLCIDADDNE